MNFLVRRDPRRRVHAQRRHRRCARPVVGLPGSRRRRGDRRARGRARRSGDGAGDGRDAARADGGRRRRGRRGDRHVAAGPPPGLRDPRRTRYARLVRAPRRATTTRSSRSTATCSVGRTQVASDTPEFRYTTLDGRRRPARRGHGRERASSPKECRRAGRSTSASPTPIRVVGDRRARWRGAGRRRGHAVRAARDRRPIPPAPLQLIG